MNLDVVPHSFSNGHDVPPELPRSNFEIERASRNDIFRMTCDRI